MSFSAKQTDSAANVFRTKPKYFPVAPQFRNFIHGFTRTKKAVTLERVSPPTVS